MTLRVALKDVKDEVNQIRKTNFKLREEAAFVLWFLRAYLADSETDALSALTGESNDKNIDAILVDEKSKKVHLVQGKFRQNESHIEKRNDVLGFAQLSAYPWENKTVLQTFYSKMDPLVRGKFEELIHRVGSGKFGLSMYYVTTGRCSKTVIREAKEIVGQAQDAVEITVIDGSQVLTMFKDYLEGVAPAIPMLSLKISPEGNVQNEGIIHRFDPLKEIESWVFSMAAKDVGYMFEKTGIRLFARNIRGFLGITEINKAMTETIEKEPENFWYYNNGVTIVCDEVKRETQGGEDCLRVEKPQVINGQQTTRTLHDASPDHGSVLVKVIKIPRHPGDDEEYDRLVNSIVRATNWQNPIKPSDLVSNDYIQVYIERSLRKLGYQYIRKKQTKSEARRLFGSQGYYQIDKLETSQAVASCEFDPAIVRKGKENLFEDPYYKSIFSSRSMSYYLSRYWLMRQVQYVARGHPEWAYAKWLILHKAWAKVSKIIATGEGERKFRHNCENYSYNQVLTLLQNAISGMFRASILLFKQERGEGEEAQDVSTFFKLTKLDRRLDVFWNSSKNPHRSKADRELRLFSSQLRRFELPN